MVARCRPGDKHKVFHGTVVAEVLVCGDKECSPAIVVDDGRMGPCIAKRFFQPFQENGAVNGCAGNAPVGITRTIEIVSVGVTCASLERVKDTLFDK